MYFIVRYNWIDCKLTDKCSVGFFRSLRKAKNYVSLYSKLKDSRRNTIAIVRLNQGHQTYNYPLVVYQWCNVYEQYVEVERIDVRRSMMVTY
jgi:hypothetical protein